MDVTFTIPSLSPCILERVNARPASSRYSKKHLLPAAGGSLTAAIPGQVRPAGQYLTGWTRDFVTVLAPPQPG